MILFWILIVQSRFHYMEKDEIEKYVLAGKIAAQVAEESRPLIKVGAPLLDIAEKIESSIREKGGMPAFPVNLSLNDEAAHYTPVPGDDRKIGLSDVIKIDIGVHVDGYIGDTAYTVSLDGKYANMIEAAKEALEKALPMCTPGMMVDDISGVIEDAIKNRGYLPVVNLTGHGLKQWEGHAEPTIHNTKIGYGYELSEGEVIAIEPFATDGGGLVKDSEPAVIFSLLGRKPARSPDARRLIREMVAFNGLPFAERWLGSSFSTRLALRELRRSGALYEYPILKEVKKGIVSQAEHTVIVGKEPLVTTKLQ